MKKDYSINSNASDEDDDFCDLDGIPLSKIEQMEQQQQSRDLLDSISLPDETMTSSSSASGVSQLINLIKTIIKCGLSCTNQNI
jgi:hypothetical protein